MTVSTDQLRQLLLSMLAPARTLSDADFAGLSDADWQMAVKISKQHRLGPTLHHRDKALGQIWPLPATVRQQWREDFQRAAFQALTHERALRGITARLAQEGIEFVALKGCWVAWHAYPHPALRPMRDIDILVASDQALATRAALLSSGFAPIERYTEPPEQALHRRKHLPGLYSVESGTVVEIHNRLVDIVESAEQNDAADQDRDDQFANRIRAEIGGNPICYLLPTDTLLHLIVHSAYDHRMNNGPAIFDDIAYILNGHQIDWNRFWSRAAAQNWIAGCELLLALACHQHGALPVSWRDGKPPEIPESVLTASMLLSLQDHKQRSVISLMGKAKAAKQSRSRVQRLLTRLAAPRHQLGPLIGVKASNPLAFAAYPLWLFKTGRQATRGLSQRSTLDDATKYAAVSQWLGAGSGGSKD